MAPKTRRYLGISILAVVFFGAIGLVYLAAPGLFRFMFDGIWMSLTWARGAVELILFAVMFGVSWPIVKFLKWAFPGFVSTINDVPGLKKERGKTLVLFAAMSILYLLTVGPYLLIKAERESKKLLEITVKDLKEAQKPIPISVTTKTEDTDLRELIEIKSIAEMNVSGIRSWGWNGNSTYPTPVDKWCDSFVRRVDGKLTWDCNDATDKICRDALSKMPKLAFANFFLAVSLKQRGDPAWVTEAEQAKKIFSLTTTIAGHKSDHDYFLNETHNLLNKK